MNVFSESIMPEILIYNETYLLAFASTLLSYFLARWLYFKSAKKFYFQPMLIATIILFSFVLTAEIPLVDYQIGTTALSWMIAPLTIGLMIPLFNHLKTIRSLLSTILLTLLLCGTFTVCITLVIAYWLGASKLALLSLSSKSVTTPVALLIAEEINGVPSLSALIVMVTGIIGTLLAPVIFKILNINDERAQGLTLGLSAHVIGTAFALEKSAKTAAFSVIAMTLTALLTAVILPLVITIFF